MAIGNLDRCITLQDYTTVQNEYGEKSQTWTTTATTRAWVRYKSGGESVFATKETMTADLIFTIRYRSGITTKTRIVYGGFNYDILHIAETGRKKYLDITAKVRE
jgi:SPP1 family predicted phage head-tail adaptor